MSDISQDVIAAQGDETILNQFIENNRHFILAAAYRSVKRTPKKNLTSAI